jgi:hypothetical protein
MTKEMNELPSPNSVDNALLDARGLIGALFVVLPTLRTNNALTAQPICGCRWESRSIKSGKPKALSGS